MNKQSVAATIIAFAFLTTFIASCRHDPLTPLEDAPLMSFKDNVQPIIISNCTQSGCHGVRGGEFELVTYDNVMAHIQAGDPHGSKLYKTISANAIGKMPPAPNAHLTDEEIKIIYLWIKQGAQNN